MSKWRQKARKTSAAGGRSGQLPDVDAEYLILPVKTGQPESSMGEDYWFIDFEVVKTLTPEVENAAKTGGTPFRNMFKYATHPEHGVALQKALMLVLTGYEEEEFDALDDETYNAAWDKYFPENGFEVIHNNIDDAQLLVCRTHVGKSQKGNSITKHFYSPAGDHFYEEEPVIERVVEAIGKLQD